LLLLLLLPALSNKVSFSVWLQSHFPGTRLYRLCAASDRIPTQSAARLDRLGTSSFFRRAAVTTESRGARRKSGFGKGDAR
jgi:hypothetical protein